MAITTDRAAALQTTSDLGLAGAVFTPATRRLDGGLWATPNGNNQTPYLGSYQGDITAVSDDIAQVLGTRAAMVNGTAYALSTTDTATLTLVQGELQTLLNDAQASTGHGHAATEAQNTIHATQLEILNQIQSDPALTSALNAATYAGDTGADNVGFQQVAAGNDAKGALHDAAAGTSLLAVGTVFNAAADLAVGGLNHANLAQENTDLKAVISGVHAILNSPTQLAQIEAGEAPQDAALTTIHLQTVANQAQLELHYDQQVATGHTTEPLARAINDNLLDIIDIVQGDANLNMAAGGNGNAGNVGGFTEQPAYLAGTISHYQDNAQQTAFWSQFIVGANQINAGLQATAAGNTAGIAALETQIQQYTQLSQGFDKAQGGVFGARFDNELLSGTEKTDAANALAALKSIAAHGVTTANAAQALAAGQGFVADAGDVSGNNTPVGGPGTSYVGTATTIAGATSPAGLGTGPLTGGTGAAGKQNGTADAGQGADASHAGTGTGQASAQPAATGHDEVHGIHHVVAEVVHAVDAHIHHAFG